MGREDLLKEFISTREKKIREIKNPVTSGYKHVYSDTITEIRKVLSKLE
jgi:hypothetical protein